MAQALGRLLKLHGELVLRVASRTPEQARRAADFIGAGVQPATYNELGGRIILCVPDDALESVAATLSDAARIVLHTSGSRGPEALDVLSRRGVACGSLHPLQTVPSPQAGVERLPGCVFAVGGDEAAAEWAQQVVSLVNGSTILIAPGCHSLYHAAAVMASNYVSALLGAAESLMAMAGVSREQALPALAPLVRAAVENAVTLGPMAALTGPVQRGDARTVASHLEALRTAPAEVVDLYRAAGRQTLTMARERGLPDEVAVSIGRLLNERN